MQKWEKIVSYSLFLLLIIYIPKNTIGQSSTDGITATTNSLSYKPGEKVTITGTVKDVISGNPVTILIRNPIQNVYAVGQVDIRNNIFVHEFVLNENSKPGTYTVDIKHGNQFFKLQFIVTSGVIQNIPVESSFIKVRGDELGLIKYKNAHVLPQENSITIELSVESSTDPIPQEFEIPKEVIDAEQSLIVEADEKTLTCSETETNQLRIMDCFIPRSTKELKFIGTSVIPEFSSITLFVLALSLVSLIVLIKIKPRQHFY